MPVDNFHGSCFVAFTDISGFKAMMKNGAQAVEAIDRFYNAGYQALISKDSINGFFVSDCGILFSREVSPERQLKDILVVIKSINRSLLGHNIMLTTSIAWGEFSYHNRIEFPGIQKQPIYGNAYASAFLDNETSLPKLKPGQCRIVKRGLPQIVLDTADANGLLRNQKNHLYYYWMVDHEDQIESFETEYKNAYNLQFAGMLQALKMQNG
jgi:hypothetical protein